MTRAVLALGSNLGNREAAISMAVRQIAELGGVELVATSMVHESVAVKLDGPDADAPAYLNAVIAIDTTLAPEQLLVAVNGIEQDLGRVRAERWADRTLDIDIITYGDQVVQTETLTIPHPRAAERSFVLEPWLDIDADAVLPGYGRVADLASSIRSENERAERLR